MLDLFTEKEREAFRVFVELGIAEPIAEECIVSRNEEELAIIIRFLDRYGMYFQK